MYNAYEQTQHSLHTNGTTHNAHFKVAQISSPRDTACRLLPNTSTAVISVTVTRSSGQSFWLQIQRSRVRSPALSDFLSSSGSGTGSTQPREVKLRSYLNKKVAAPGSENRD